MKNQSNNNYSSIKPKLLKDFDKTANLVRNSVAIRYSEDFAETLYQEVRHEFEALIPQMPYIDKKAMTLRKFLFITTQELAVYKAMKEHGKTPSEAWEICHDALRERLNKVSALMRWIAKKMYFSTIMKSIMRKMIAKTQQQSLSGFVLEFVEGDGQNFDFGVNYLECPMQQFVRDQGAEEFAPYPCLSDVVLGETFGWGVIRSETLGDGCKRCNFRFKKGGNTRITSPTPEVQATIERIREKEAA